MKNTNSMQVVYGDVNLGLHGDEFSFLFSYHTGGMESLVLSDKEWLYRKPVPTFWRATTDNDRGNKFHLRSGMWLGADMFIECFKIKIVIDGVEINPPIAPENNKYVGSNIASEVEIKYYYRTITTPATIVSISYHVRADGDIRVDVDYKGKKGLPELPVFGIRFVMPTAALGYQYQGLSGETYPDRKEGGIFGTYQIDKTPVTPYLVPQDCNMHVDTDWVEVYRDTTLSNVNCNKEKFGIRFYSLDKKISFSCIPYTAEELENATHQEELPPPRRTVVCINGAVRGVGGIDSWGTDVESAYHIDGEKDIHFSFGITKAN